MGVERRYVISMENKEVKLLDKTNSPVITMIFAINPMTEITPKITGTMTVINKLKNQ